MTFGWLSWLCIVHCVVCGVFFCCACVLCLSVVTVCCASLWFCLWFCVCLCVCVCVCVWVCVFICVCALLCLFLWFLLSVLKARDLSQPPSKLVSGSGIGFVNKTNVCL